MVLGCEPAPQAAVRFEVMLKNILDVGVGELEELRREVMSHFKSMLTSLGIEEPSPDERLYEFSLQQMQTYYFQSMDLTGLTGGPDQAAEIVARHMRWNFNLERFQFTLRIPAGEHMLLYTADEKGVRRESGPAPAVDVAWSVRRRGFALLSGGESWGEIRTLVKPMDKQHAEIALYARFLGLGYEQYCLRQAVLEMKAHTLDSLPVGVARLDADGRTLQVNPRLAEFLGADEHDEDVTRYLPVSRFFGAEQEWLSFLRDPQSRTFSRIFCAGGVLEGDPEDMDRCLYLWASKRKVRERDEVLLLVEDVSQVSDLEVQALKQREFLEKLVASMRDVVLVVDRQGVITYVSPLLPESFIGLSVFEIANPMGHFAGIWGPHYLEARKEPLEAVILTGERELRPYELVFTPLRPGLDGKQSFLVVGRDLSTVRRLEEKLKRQAIYDGLTGLFNHEQFLAILKQEVERAERTGRGRPAVVFIDLDGFKAINDRYGHQVGDEVLKFVGKAIRSNIRSGMDFPCRYGGDEFTVVLTEVDRASDLDRLCQRIKAGINKAWREHLSVSIGAAMRAGEEDAEELLRRADRSVYKAKTSGGDRIIFGDSA
jgi:diguanylate cyclase (GGDEF)-like protein